MFHRNEDQLRVADVDKIMECVFSDGEIKVHRFAGFIDVPLRRAVLSQICGPIGVAGRENRVAR
jgi:hypothetical protein